MRRKIHAADVWPSGWSDLLTEHPVGIGYDLATTTKDKSNPSAIAVGQKVGMKIITRALIRFKTADPKVARSILNHGITAIEQRLLPIRRLCIDATNERYYAADVRDDLAGRCPVELVISSETMNYLGEDMLVKTYLANQYISFIDDGLLWLPNAEWVKKDARSVKRKDGGFYNELDEDGNHGDAFDGTKLMIHALVSAGGPVSAKACQVGTFGGKIAAIGRRLLNPYANRHGR